MGKTIIEKAMDEGVKMQSETASPLRSLSASSLGGDCQRRRFYDVTHQSQRVFTPVSALNYQSRSGGEGRMASLLRGVEGVTLRTKSGEKGSGCIRFEIGGWLISGGVSGIIQMDGGEKMVWEHLHSAESTYKKLKSKIKKDPETALKNFSLESYAQAQLAMHALGKRAHYLTSETGRGRMLQEVITQYDKSFAEKMIQRAREVGMAKTPQALARMSDEGDEWACSDPDFGCPHAGVCHEGKLPLAGCRTCSYVTEGDGAARLCGLYNNKIIPLDFQSKGCPGHLYNPVFIDESFEFVGYNQETATAEYLTKGEAEFAVTNGKGRESFTSKELKFAHNEGLMSKDLVSIKRAFGARIIEGQEEEVGVKPSDPRSEDNRVPNSRGVIK